MTERTVRGFEVAAYCGVLLMAIAVGGNAVKKHVTAGATRRVAALTAASQKPSQVNLLNVDWKANKRTLLLALSAQCRYCNESAAFYQKLATDNAIRERVRIIAVFPQAVTEGQAFLESNGIPGVEVKQEHLGQIGLTIVPSLLLIDEHGKVVDFWPGMLNRDQQAAVVARCRQLS